MKIFEKILTDLLKYYLGLDDVSLEKHLTEKDLATKERVETINDLQVKIYPNDHNPPHFHAIYGSEEILVGIDPIEVLEGKMKRRAVSMVIEWAAVHQQELKRNWEFLQSDGSAEKIEPLD